MKNEQLDLFHIYFEEEQKKQEEKRRQELETKKDHSAPKNGEIDYSLFDDCPKCHVKPVTSKYKSATIDTGMQIHIAIICPICGYSCATLYDPYEHWNICNRYRVRDGFKFG